MSLASLFGGKNPFRGLQDHMQVVNACAQLVTPLFEALVAGETERVAQIAEEISDLEDEADRIKNELRVNLPKSLFMPVDRRDLLDILTYQDSIADTAEDIAGMFLVRQMPVHEFLKEPLLELSRRCVEITGDCAEIIGRIDGLLEVGFKGPQVDKVQELISKLHTAEDLTDGIEQELIKRLFTHEDEMKPVAVVMWERVIEWVGDLADYSQKVGDRVLLIIAN